MRRPEIDHVRKTKSGFVVQTLTREAKKPKSSGVFVSQREPTTQVMCRLSDASCARAHATTLNRATAHGLYSVGQSLLRLQRHYGNHYVQRVVAHFDNQKPKQIRRAEGDPPAPVVIVSGPKKIPKLKEDAAEKLIRSTGAKLEKAGRYRFVPVSGYADFVANAHKRLEAKETASTVLIDGHGGSDADSAWMTMGSATDPNRGWGTTDCAAGRR